MRMKKKLLIIVPAVFLIILIGWYFYFRTTAQYSILQLTGAYKAHDITLAKTYMDIDGLSSQVGDEVEKSIREAINQPSASTNEWEKLGAEYAKTWIESMIPSLVQKTKDEMKQAMEDSIEGKDPKEGVYPMFRTLSWRDVLPGGKLKVQSSGAIRLVSVPSQQGDTLTFRMRNEDGHWKIVRWENLAEISKKLADENLKKESENEAAKSKNAKFEERVNILEGWYLTVDAPQDYVSKSYSQPKEGNKYITIEVTYDNSGSSAGTYDPSNFELKDNEDHRYKRDYSGKEPQLNDGTLPPNQKSKGFITYEVPTTATTMQVIYSSSAGGNIVFSQ